MLDDAIHLHSFPTRRSSDLSEREYQLTKEAEWKLKSYLYKQKSESIQNFSNARCVRNIIEHAIRMQAVRLIYLDERSEEHTSELQSRFDLVCRLLLEKKQRH